MGTGNMFSSDTSNVANIKSQHIQIMTTITNRFLKLESMMKYRRYQTIHFLLLLFLARTFSSLKSIVCQYNVYKIHLSKIKKLPLIRIKKMIYNYIMTIVSLFLQVIFSFLKKQKSTRTDCKRFIFYTIF